MKIFILVLLLCCSLNFNKDNVYASAKYARIENVCNLYSNSSDNSQVICIAEKTYFVQILNEIDNMYKVNYNGVSGYVNKNDVKEITSTPSTPYPQNIKLKIGSNCNFRSSPTAKSNTNNVLSTISAGETNIEFIGRIFADEAIDFGGNTWYYVKYLGDYGYIYNQYVQSITPIYENTESFSYIQETHNDIQNPITHTPSLMLIIIMFIPLLIILLILYLPRKFKQKQKKQKEIKIIDKY